MQIILATAYNCWFYWHMRPKDLKHPFTWDTRRVVLSDRVLFVPKHFGDYGSYDPLNWSSPEVFGNDAQVHVEYCSGNGCWIVAKAQEQSNMNWIAVEKRFDRVRKIWSKAKNRGLSNLFIICGDARVVTKYYIRSDSVTQASINFPDPWPKLRHAKHRLVAPDFIGDVGRVLKGSGSLTVVTDDPSYSDLITVTLQASSCFLSLHPEPHYITHYPNYGDSFFNELWCNKGRTIRYHEYVKKQET